VHAAIAQRKILYLDGIVGCVATDTLHLQQTARSLEDFVNRFRLSYREEDPRDVMA